MTWASVLNVKKGQFLKVRKTMYSLLQELKTTIILNPFEWTICWGAICFFTGSYLEHLIGWFSPIKEENENDKKKRT